MRLGAPGDASEEELEEPERPSAGREARWERIAQSAVKQSLRCAPGHVIRPQAPELGVGF